MRFFKPSEFDSPDEKGSGLRMNHDFLKKIEDARGRCNFPWRVTAGFRTPAHNKLIGGALASKHLTGEAVDIACTDSAKRFAIVKAAMEAGIRGIEVADRHIHLDNRTKPTLWPDKSR